MTNSTEFPSRRAALGALAVVPSLALPAFAMAHGAGAAADAELLDLVKAERSLAVKVDEACQADEEALARTEWPPAPDTLICRDDDNYFDCRKVNERFEETDRGQIACVLQTLKRISRRDLMEKHAPELIDFQLRGEEIIDGLNQHRAARHLASERSGLREASERYEDLIDEHRQLWLRIAKTPARTTTGLLAKLSIVARSNCFEEEAGKWEEGSEDDVLQSVAVDAAALGLGAGA